jgi:hypothetical protein
MMKFCYVVEVISVSVDIVIKSCVFVVYCKYYEQ